MDRDQCDALIHRLERLERRFSRWKALELYGPSGKIHASMAVKGSGQPHLALYDRLGRVLWRAP